MHKEIKYLVEHELEGTKLSVSNFVQCGVIKVFNPYDPSECVGYQFVYELHDIASHRNLSNYLCNTNYCNYFGIFTKGGDRAEVEFVRVNNTSGRPRQKVIKTTFEEELVYQSVQNKAIFSRESYVKILKRITIINYLFAETAACDFDYHSFEST